MLSYYQRLSKRIYHISFIRRLIHLVFLIVLFTVLSLLFYFPIWHQLIAKPDPHILVLQGEYPVYEFVAETVRKNILTLSNPFQITDGVLYPFGWRYAFDDVAPINGFYFVILRNFLSIHQSLICIVLAGIIANGISMFYLLRKLSFDLYCSYIVSIVFAFTPFVSLRLPAHPTYVAIYLFPLSALCFLQLMTIKDTNVKEKYWWSIALGGSLVLFVLTNLYYTVMFTIMCILLFAFSYSYKLIKQLRKNIRYFAVASITAMLLLAPWFIEVYGIVLRRLIDKPKNIYDMTTFSADLVNILIPSSLNPFYSYFVNRLAQQHAYIQTIFENFTYPGVLLLYGIVGYFMQRKYLPKELKPLIWTIVSFFVLTLGPSLHVLGKDTHIMLPYLAIAHAPLLQMARSPGRFIVPLIFLSSIVLAYVLQQILKTKSNGKQLVFYIFLFSIFLIDQRIIISKPPEIRLPFNIYHFLSQQEQTPVLEIPFSIRDSIKNYGNYHTHWSSYAQLLHMHPIFGIYAGRVPNSIFQYYIANPLLNPIARIVDTNGTDISSKRAMIQKGKLQEALDIYGVEYSILKLNEPFTKEMAMLLSQSGFRKIQTDSSYTLWKRNRKHIEMPRIQFDTTYPEILIGDGWSPAEPGEKSRWMMNKTSRIFISIFNPKKKSVAMTAQSFVGSQVVEVYLNSKYIGTMKFSNDAYTTEVIPINKPLKTGLNIITLYVDRTYRPSDYIEHSQDQRELSLHVHSISLH